MQQTTVEVQLNVKCLHNSGKTSKYLKLRSQVILGSAMYTSDILYI